MKILFINDTMAADYQADSVYHGLKSVWGNDVECATDLWYMYNTLEVKEKHFLYGLGFTLYGLLPVEIKNVPTPTCIVERINTHYYNFIVYGSIIRSKLLLESVLKTYNNNEVIFIDGEDDQNIDYELVNSGLYFKRELADDVKTENVYPISFGIPKSKIVEIIPEKIRDWSINTPADILSYIHRNEQSYYQDYQDSRYAVTFKKAGWDCLRHYEIMANGCLPYFKDIAKCPTNTLFDFPKDFLKQLLTDIDNKSIGKEEYLNAVNYLLNYTRTNLTTESLANKLITKAKAIGLSKKNSINPLTTDISFGWNVPEINITDKLDVGFISSVNNIQMARLISDKFERIYIQSGFESAIHSLKTLDTDNFIYINDLSEIKEKLDVAILHHNLNYEYNHTSYLIQLKQKLKIGAEILITVNNAQSAYNMNNFLRGTLNMNSMLLSNKRAVNFYSLSSIKNLLSKLRFNIIYSNTSGYTSKKGVLVSKYLPGLKSIFQKEIFIRAVNKN